MASRESDGKARSAREQRPVFDRNEDMGGSVWSGASGRGGISSGQPHPSGARPQRAPHLEQGFVHDDGGQLQGGFPREGGFIREDGSCHQHAISTPETPYMFASVGLILVETEPSDDPISCGEKFHPNFNLLRFGVRRPNRDRILAPDRGFINRRFCPGLRK